MRERRFSARAEQRQAHDFPLDEGWRGGREDVAQMLEAAGLQLWQAPEGFWAIRVKPARAQQRRGGFSDGGPKMA